MHFQFADTNRKILPLLQVYFYFFKLGLSLLLRISTFFDYLSGKIKRKQPFLPVSVSVFSNNQPDFLMEHPFKRKSYKFEKNIFKFRFTLQKVLVNSIFVKNIHLVSDSLLRQFSHFSVFLRHILFYTILTRL